MTARQQKHLNWTMIGIILTALVLFGGFIKEEETHASKSSVGAQRDRIIKLEAAEQYNLQVHEQLWRWMESADTKLDTLLQRTAP